MTTPDFIGTFYFLYYKIRFIQKGGKRREAITHKTHFSEMQGTSWMTSSSPTLLSLRIVLQGRGHGESVLPHTWPLPDGPHLINKELAWSIY